MSDGQLLKEMGKRIHEKRKALNKEELSLLSDLIAYMRKK